MLCGCNICGYYIQNQTINAPISYGIRIVNSIGLTKAGMERYAMRVLPWSAEYHIVTFLETPYRTAISQG